MPKQILHLNEAFSDNPEERQENFMTFCELLRYTRQALKEDFEPNIGIGHLETLIGDYLVWFREEIEKGNLFSLKDQFFKNVIELCLDTTHNEYALKLFETMLKAYPELQYSESIAEVINDHSIDPDDPSSYSPFTFLLEDWLHAMKHNEKAKDERIEELERQLSVALGQIEPDNLVKWEFVSSQTRAKG